MQTLVDMLVLSSLYALLGAAYVIVYRASRVLNLAQGELMMLGGYLFVTFAVSLGLGLVLGSVVALVVAAAVAALVYVMLIRPIAGRSVFIAVLVTVAVGIVVRAGAQLLWGTETKKPLNELGIANDAIRLGDGVIISTASAIQVLAAVVFIGGLLVALRFARTGIQMRGVAENVLLASQRGVKVNWVLALSWATAGVVGGLAGILYSADVQLTPQTADIGLKALAIPLLGGLTSVGGVIPAALVVGGLETLIAQNGDPLLARTVPFMVILAVLVVRPWGVFGTKEELSRV